MCWDVPLCCWFRTFLVIFTRIIVHMHKLYVNDTYTYKLIIINAWHVCSLFDHQSICALFVCWLSPQDVEEEQGKVCARTVAPLHAALVGDQWWDDRGDEGKAARLAQARAGDVKPASLRSLQAAQILATCLEQRLFPNSLRSVTESNCSRVLVRRRFVQT